MPFTPAHAAAVIPFQRTRLIPSALVIGSFSPDFEYFLRFGPRGGFGHTLPGLFALDLPISFLVLWLFHAYAKDPILAWLPAGVGQRLPFSTALSSMRKMSGITLITISLLIGAATHLLWDSFTHDDYWPYRHWHFLRLTAELPFAGTVQCFTILQYLSSLAGLVVLLLWFRHWYRHTKPHGLPGMERSARDEGAVFAVLCVGAAVAAVFRGVLGFSTPITPHECELLLSETVITAMTVLWFEIVAYGLFRARRRFGLKRV